MPAPDLPAHDLPTLAARVRAAHADCEASLQKGLDYALECGRYLIEAKSQVPYGEWITWVRDQCEMSEQLAQRYMRVAKHWPRLTEEADTSRVTHLSFRQALELIARNAQATANVPPEQRGRLLSHAEQADYLSIGPSARELHEEEEVRRRAEQQPWRAEARRRAEEARRYRRDPRWPEQRRDVPEEPFDPASLGTAQEAAAQFDVEGGYQGGHQGDYQPLSAMQPDVGPVAESGCQPLSQDQRQQIHTRLTALEDAARQLGQLADTLPAQDRIADYLQRLVRSCQDRIEQVRREMERS